MQTFQALTSRRPRLTWLLRVCTAAIVFSLPAGLPQTVRADGVTPPPVPDNLQVPAGNQAFLVGHATVGTQGYLCEPCPNATTTTCPASGFIWTFVKPQATLLDDNQQQIITHFLSTNQFETPASARPTWQDSMDTSRVWGKSIANSSDPTFVAAGAIPWLLLQVVGSQPGPTGGATLTVATYIQRLSTTGGVAPSTGCAQSSDVGNKALVPYTADYFFFKAE